MKNRRLRKSTVYLLYSLGFVFLIGMAFLVENTFSSRTFDEDTTYVNDTILKDDIKPVISNDVVIIKPFKNNEVKILKNYYDYTADEEEQLNSIITYNNTYLQNTGVCYGGVESFDVVSILDGTIKSVKEDEVLGTIVQVEHDNNIVSIYQSLSNVSLKAGDKIAQGDIIGTSGTNNLNKDLNNHLHFELLINGENVNPENYYNKSINE